MLSVIFVVGSMIVAGVGIDVVRHRYYKVDEATLARFRLMLRHRGVAVQ